MIDTSDLIRGIELTFKDYDGVMRRAFFLSYSKDGSLHVAEMYKGEFARYRSLDPARVRRIWRKKKQANASRKTRLLARRNNS